VAYAFTKSAILELHAWMHDCLAATLTHAGTIPEHLLAAAVAGFGRPTLQHQIAHVLTTELAWVRALQWLPIQRIDPATLMTMEHARREQKRVAAATVAYLDQISEEQLNTELARYPEDWLGAPRPPAFILLHIITHSFHHKGQIVAMMRLLGYPAPDTDMQRE
jgi:uncharacterized damage-inducible protein DinB